MRNAVAKDSAEAATIIEHMLKAVRHCQVLGLEFSSFEDSKLTLKLPYSQSIVGNPDTGVIHGGALTTLMDTACGFVIPISLNEFQICPTLDLRIDYMTAAQPRLPVYGSSEIYRVTENVIFSRGIAYQNDIDKPIAHCVATFMRLPKDVTDSKREKA